MNEKIELKYTHIYSINQLNFNFNYFLNKKFSGLPNDDTAMYLNYKIFDDIIIEIGKSKQKRIKLNNNNKFADFL